VSCALERGNQFVEKLSMPSNGQSFDVLEHEVARFELRNHTNEFFDQGIARVVERSLADQREPLARRPAKNDIDHAAPDSGGCANFGTAKLSDRSRNYRALGKIELVDRCMDGIDLNSRDYIETSLFEAQAEPACARE